MQIDEQNSATRLAAVVALIVAFLVFMVIVVSSLAGGDSDEPTSREGDRQTREERPISEERKVYVVKPGDCCLSQIAQRTGVDVDTLIQLNPNLDPQAIHSGDRVKLR